MGAKQVTNFRSIANLRLLYNMFAHLLSGRLEQVFAGQQPEKRHGCRAGWRLKEHLLSTFFLTKQKQLDFLSGINVDLSKTFHTCRISGHGLSPTDSRWTPHDWPHQSELNIKDVKVTLFDTAMPCGETSNRVHGSIVIQKSVFVRMESTRSSCVDQKCLLQQWCVQLGSWCGLVAVPRLWKWLFSTHLNPNLFCPVL